MKQEPVSDSPPTSKFPEYFGGWTGSFNQEVPQYPMENGIFVAPVEDLGNNPYKQLETNEEGSVSFQKYPLFQDEHNWPISRETSGGASYLPQMAFEKKENSEKEEEVLAQLFSLSGFINDESPFEIPSNNDMLIPMQTPSPASIGEPSNHVSTPYQPAAELDYSPQSSSENVYYSNVYNGTVSPNNNNNCIDPLVSVFNEGGMSSPPNNDLSPQVSNNAEKPTDDLQMILDEILAVENLPLENNGFVSQNTDEILLQKMMAIDEENNQMDKPDDLGEEDMHIPYDTFQFPPPSKKRLSESSSSSCMDESPPPSIPQSRSMDHSPTNTFSSPPTPESDHEKSTSKTPSHKARGSTVNLFGQKEDEIIDKLLIPKPGSANKPVTRDKLVTMNVEDFNGLLDQGSLTEIEIAFMKEWRRRGKNKMAAQIARKRKRDELSELQDEIEILRRQKAQLKQQSNNLKSTVNSYKKRAQTAEERIYRKYSTVHGSTVSRDTHNIHVTDDGKTMLVPRMSSQMLLV